MALSKNFSFYTQKLDDINRHFWIYIHLLEVDEAIVLFQTFKPDILEDLENLDPENKEKYSKLQKKFSKIKNLKTGNLWDFSDEVKKELIGFKEKTKAVFLAELAKKLEVVFETDFERFEKISCSKKLEINLGVFLRKERVLEEKKANYALLLDYFYLTNRLSFEQKYYLSI